MDQVVTTNHFSTLDLVALKLDESQITAHSRATGSDPASVTTLEACSPLRPSKPATSAPTSSTDTIPLRRRRTVCMIDECGI